MKDVLQAGKKPWTPLLLLIWVSSRFPLRSPAGSLRPVAQERQKGRFSVVTTPLKLVRRFVALVCSEKDLDND